MADFDFSTLITDRGQSDLATLRSVLSTPMEEWTAEQLAAFNLAASKGAYNYTDLNRVTACMDYLNERLTGLGYETGYSSVVVHQPQPQQPTLPDGYTELEYIQSNGTQYINTGVNPDQDTRVVADLQPIAVSICGIFGARIAKETACFVLWQVDQTNIEDNYGSDATRVSVPSTTTRVLVDKNKNQLSYGDTIFTATEETFSCNYPMALFGVNSGGVIDNRRVSMRLYSCKIYDNGALVRDFLPCSNPSGAVGLYDLANGAFYANAGTGVFTAGPEIPPEPEPEPLDPYTWYEEDVPTESTMAGYLANVSALREVLTLPENTTEVPADMAGLTLAEANAIEEILLVIEDYLTALASVFRRCDAAICGGPGFYFKN